MKPNLTRSNAHNVQLLNVGSDSGSEVQVWKGPESSLMVVLWESFCAKLKKMDFHPTFSRLCGMSGWEYGAPAPRPESHRKHPDFSSRFVLVFQVNNQESPDSFSQHRRPPFWWTACTRRMFSESRLTAPSRGMTALWCSLWLFFTLPPCVAPARLPTAQPTGRKLQRVSGPTTGPVVLPYLNRTILGCDRVS